MALRRGRGLLFLALGATIFLVYLVYSNPFSALQEAGRINFAFFLLAIIINNVGLLFFAVSWFLLLRGMGVGISLREATQATFISLFVVWMIPIPVGSEIIRAYLVRNKENSGVGKAVASVIIHKSMYNISFGVLLAIATVLFTTTYGGMIPISSGLLWFVIAFAAGSSILFTLILNERLLRWLYLRCPPWLRSRISDVLGGSGLGVDAFEKIVGGIGLAVSQLKSKVGLDLTAFLMVAFHWSSGSIATYFIALSLGYSINIWEIVLIYAVIEFIQQLNIVIPGGLGIVDAGLTGAFVLVGVPLSAAAAISLLTRLVTYWLEVVLSFAISIHYGYRELLKEYFEFKKPI